MNAMPTPIRAIVVILIGFPAFWFWFIGAVAAVGSILVAATHSPPIHRLGLGSHYLTNQIAGMSLGYLMFEFARMLLGEGNRPAVKMARSVFLNWLLQMILLGFIFGVVGLFWQTHGEDRKRALPTAVLGFSVGAVICWHYLKQKWLGPPASTKPQEGDLPNS